ncbi:unnamed protein product, partial [marine sediment metagenome]
LTVSRKDESQFFAQTSPIACVKHGNPGSGATKSSAYVPLK